MLGVDQILSAYDRTAEKKARVRDSVQDRYGPISVAGDTHRALFITSV